MNSNAMDALDLSHIWKWNISLIIHVSNKRSHWELENNLNWWVMKICQTCGVELYPWLQPWSSLQRFCLRGNILLWIHFWFYNRGRWCYWHLVNGGHIATDLHKTVPTTRHCLPYMLIKPRLRGNFNVLNVNIKKERLIISDLSIHLKKLIME